MVASRLRNALVCFGLLWSTGAATPIQAAPEQKVSRPQLTSLVIGLEDGRSYSLTQKELNDPKGGAIFWGDWAVTHLLVPEAYFNKKFKGSAEDLFRLWFTPGRSGELPAFLVQTGSGAAYPLDPGGPDRHTDSFGRALRPRIQSILVGYADGRRIPMSELALRDEKSGILLWSDYAVSNILLPFYLSAKDLPTSPEDVMRIWNQPSPAPTSASAPASRSMVMTPNELPAYLVKPMCIPSYMGSD